PPSRSGSTSSIRLGSNPSSHS
ncbi:hypothetical protein D018_0571B, partial [Vibrio parahaemolyticus VP2007-007]